MKIHPKIVIVILTEYNFIDNIAPIIDLLVQNDYKVILIETNYTYNYKNDNNLKYLHDKYKNIVNIELYESIFGFKIKNFTKIGKKLNRHLNGNFSDTICIMDHSSGDDNKSNNYLKNLIMQHNIQCIAFNHGLDMTTNLLETVYDLKFNTSVDNNLTFAQKFATKLVVYNEQNKERQSKNISKKYSDKISVLPTLRYSSYWLSEIQKSYKNFDFETNKLKIVYLISSENYNVWTEEEYRTLAAISNISNVHLIIKPHPRTNKTVKLIKKIKSDNITILNNSYPSSALIDWSDIVLFNMTTISVEAVMKDKHLINLSYLCCNRLNIESYEGLVYNAYTRDDTINIIENIKKNKTKKVDLEMKQSYVSQYVNNDSEEENKMQYLKLFKDFNAK